MREILDSWLWRWRRSDVYESTDNEPNYIKHSTPAWVRNNDRLLRAVRAGVCSLFVGWISFTEDLIVDGYAWVILCFFGVSILMGPNGIASLSYIMLLTLNMFFGWIVCSILFLALLIGGWAGKLVAAIVFAIILLIMTGSKSGPMGALGGTLASIASLFVVTLFFGLLPFFEHGILINIPSSDLQNITQEVYDALVDLGEIVGDLPPLDDLINGGGEASNDSAMVHITVEPGVWMIGSFVWEGTSSAASAIGPLCFQIVIGILLQVAMYVLPPWESQRHLARLALMRVVWRIQQDLTSHAQHIKGTKPIQKNPKLDEYARGRLRGQAIDVFNELQFAEDTLKTCAGLVPNTLEPYPGVSYDIPLIGCEMKLAELYSKVSFFEQSDVTQLVLHTDQKLKDEIAATISCACDLLEKLGNALNVTPRYHNKGEVMALLGELDDTPLRAQLDRTVQLATDLLRANVEANDVSFDVVLPELALFFSEFRIVFVDSVVAPVAMMKAVIATSYKAEPKTAFTAFLNLFFLFTLAGLKGIYMGCLSVVKNAGTTWIWRPSPQAWWMDRGVHDILRTNLAFNSIFLFFLLVPSSRSWVWPECTDCDLSGDDYLDPKIVLSNKIPAWAFLGFVLALFKTNEASAAKFVSRSVGTVLGGLGSLLIAYTTADAWGYIGWLAAMLAVQVYLSSGPGSHNLFYVSGTYNYAIASAFITTICISGAYFGSMDKYTIEYYVISRAGGQLIGGFVGLLFGLFILPTSAGANTRAGYIKITQTTIAAVQSAESASRVDWSAESVQPFAGLLGGAKITMKTDVEGYLFDAKVMARGPVLATDPRLYYLHFLYRRMFMDADMMAATLITPPTKNAAADGDSQIALGISMQMLVDHDKSSLSVHDHSMVALVSMEDLDTKVETQPVRASPTEMYEAFVQKGFYVDIHDRLLKVMAEQELMIRGLLLQQSSYDSYDIPYLSSIDGVRENGEREADEEALRSLRRIGDCKWEYSHADFRVLHWDPMFRKIFMTCTDMGISHREFLDDFQMEPRWRQQFLLLTVLSKFVGSLSKIVDHLYKHPQSDVTQPLPQRMTCLYNARYQHASKFLRRQESSTNEP